MQTISVYWLICVGKMDEMYDKNLLRINFHSYAKLSMELFLHSFVLKFQVRWIETLLSLSFMIIVSVLSVLNVCIDTRARSCICEYYNVEYIRDAMRFDDKKEYQNTFFCFVDSRAIAKFLFTFRFRFILRCHFF